MTTALSALAGTALGALGSQSRSAQATQRHQDQSTLAIAMAKDTKAAKAARENADKERLMAILMDPQIMGLLTVFGGLLAANHIPWTGDPEARARIAGVAAAAAVLMGLGRAGVGDLTTLGVATAAGVAVGMEGITPLSIARAAGGATTGWQQYLPPPFGLGAFAFTD